MTETQAGNTGLAKGEVALCDIIDAKGKRLTGEQIDVTIVDVRYNGDTPQSYRVYCKTERDTDKYIWVQAQYIHVKPPVISAEEALLNEIDG